MGAVTTTFARRAWRTLVLLALTLAFAAPTPSFAQTGRLLQLSTRDQVLTGDDVMIGGFVIAGSSNKTVAIVATGPSLAAYGVANPLGDPILTLVRSADRSVIATNDNWQTASNSAQLQATGLAPTHPQEAAILINLQPGAYTAIVEGAGGGTGVGIIAVYEVDHPEAPLVNISTRARVLTGENVMIAGFSVGPSDPNPVVVTVAGPSLAQYGVANPLQNPNLALVRMSDRTVIATNDDWQVQANPGDVASLQANGLHPSDPREPAIIATLQPGLYTAIASGVGNTTGVAVVSVYQAIRSVAITSANNATFTVGTAGTFTITTAATPTATSITTTPLPAGLSLSATSGTGTATISGTPTGPTGTFTITITASNGGVTPDGTQSFTLTVNQAPAITSANAATFQLGSPSTHTVVATGSPTPTLSVSGALPAGVTFDPATGVLSGTPTAGGIFPIVFTAANGVGSNATQNFTLTVNQTVAITSANAATFTVGTAGSFTITTSATPTANLITITGALPAGVTLGATSGTGTAVLSGTPAGGTGGSYPVTITASNGGVTPNGTQSFTLTVGQAPAITSGSSPTFTVGVAGSHSVTVTGFPTPTISLSTSTLPAGLTFNPATRVLAGTPAPGTGGFWYPNSFTATNGVAPNDVQPFTVIVNQPPAVTSANNATFTVGTPGTFNVTASGFPAAMTFSTASALPSGVTLSAAGLLSGTPGAGTGGSYPITITASNGIAPAGTQSFTLNVNQAPVITSANNATFGIGIANTFNVIATGFPAPTRSTASTLPSGVTLSPAGVLSGTPAVGTGGTYPITITATNGVAPDATQSFTLTVNQAPIITSANATTFTVGAPGTFTVTASGFPAAMTFTTGSTLPSGVTLSSAGLLSGTPVAGTAGIYPITITASNGVAPAGTQAFTLTVVQAPAITSGNAVTFTVGIGATFSVTTTGFPTGAAMVIGETGALPSGITFTDNNDGTATLGGTAAAGTAAGSPYPITITANNGVAPTASQPFTITVQDFPGANPESYSTVHDTVLNVNAVLGLLANDTGTPAPTMQSVTGPGPVTCGAFPCTIPTQHGSVTVAIDGSFTYTPAASFAGADFFDYTIVNAAGAAGSLASITVTNALPVVDLNGPAGGIDFAAAFTEGSGPVAIVDPAQLTVTDADDTQLTGATIAITNLQDGVSESLGFTCTAVAPACEGAIPVAAVTYTAATGTLEILATAPLVDFEKLLRTITYVNASANPTGATRDVTFTINDGNDDNVPVAHSIVTIFGVNNPPTITAPATATTAINAPRVFAGTVSVADSDAGAADIQVTLTATNGTVTLSTTAGFTSVTGNGTASVVATGPLASQNAALNGMSFTPTPAYSGPATLAISANDLGNTGTGGAQSAVPKTINITVDTPPSVLTTVPANGVAAVPTTSTVTVNFSENVTVSGASFTMSCSVSGARAFNAPVGSGTATIVLTPALALPGGETCTVTVVAAQVTDSAAQNMTADYVFSFAVNTRPTVTSTVPTNGATAVNPATTITINFSESVNVTGTAFTLSCSGAIPFTVSLASPSASYTLTPSPVLPSGTLCNVNVVAAQVTDVDGGQTMAADFPFLFTTGVPPAITSANNTTFTVGSVKTFTVTTTGTPTVTNISMAPVTPGPGGTLPSGVAFSYTSGANATVSGTANNAAHVGTYVVSFTATNGVPPDAVQSPFTLTLVCPAITLGPAPGTLTASFNQPYTQAFTPAGGTAPYSYVVVGSLPNVAFSGNNLTGTPNNTGSFAFTVKAVDTFGCASPVQSYTLNVRPFVQFDTYPALGNVLLDSNSGPGLPFSVVDNDAFPAGTTITGFDTTSAHSGTVTMITSGPFMGRFTYDPPVGYTGSDDFTYTLTSNGQSVIGNVTMTVSGIVWFVKNGAGACSSGSCDGRMSHPFTDMSTFQAANTGLLGPLKPQAGHPIFVYGTGTNYSGNTTLLAGQRLVGEGATATVASLAVVTPQNGQTLPSTPGTSPVLGGQLTVGSGNFLHGLTLSGNTALRSTANVGTLTINDNMSINTTGAGIDLGFGGTLSGGFTSLTSQGGAINVSLGSMATSGTFNLGSSGALSGATTAGLAINGQNGNYDYSGTISNTNATGRAVNIANKTGGTVNLSGDINPSAAGAGILMQSSTGTNTYNLSGSQKKINSGSQPGVTLSSNSGSTINITGGGLNIATTSATGFDASGGGTVNVVGANNTISSTTGTALNVANTSIGASGLTFQSISANGAAKGIVLNNTGTAAGNGGLSITGTGTTDGSGGTIQNISARGGEFITTKALSIKNVNFTNANTADGGTCTDLSTAACNAAIYLSAVSTVALDNINVTGTTAQQAINGLNVSNFSLTNSTLANCGTSGTVEEGCIKMRELTGTSSITGSDLSFPAQDVVEIVNTAGSLAFNVDNSVFRDSQSSGAGGNGLQVRSQGTATTVMNVTNSSFLRLRTTGIHATAINSASNDVDVTNNTFDPGTGTMIGLDLDADNTGTLVFNVQNNPKIYSRNGPAVNVFGDTNATINGRINNNPDVQVKSNVGGNVGSGIRANINKDAIARIEVKNNVVNVGSDDAGIDLTGIGKTTANPGGATNTLDATVTGNNVTIGATSTYGVFIISASNAGDTNAICANVSSNTITRNPSSIASYRARVPSVNGFFRMEGFVTNAEATWNARGNTPASAGGSEVSFGGSGTFGSCTAALPTNPGPN